MENHRTYIIPGISKQGICIYKIRMLVGALPNPLPVTEVPSAAARFANAFSGPCHLSCVCPGPGLCETQKEKSRVQRFDFL